MKRRLTKTRRRKIIRDYKVGWGLVRLADEHGVSDAVIKKVLSDGGIRIRAPGRPRSQKDRSTIKDGWWEIWDMREGGMSYGDIGGVLGCSRQYCWQVCEKVRERKSK